MLETYTDQDPSCRRWKKKLLHVQRDKIVSMLLTDSFPSGLIDSSLTWACPHLCSDTMLILTCSLHSIVRSI